MDYNELNVGDNIYVFLRDYRKYYKGTVVKKSNTTVQVEIVLRGTPIKYIFNTNTGLERGANQYYMGGNRLARYSDEECEAHNKAQDEENNRNYIIRVATSKLDWRAVSTEDVYKIYEILKPYWKEQKDVK